MKKIPPILLLILCALDGLCGPLRSISSIQAACQHANSRGATFDISGVVWSLYKRVKDGWILTLYDGQSVFDFYELRTPDTPCVGPDDFDLLDVVHVRGRLYEYEGDLYAGYDTAKRLSRGNRSSLPRISPADLLDSRYLMKMVKLGGLVRDVAYDDSDPNFVHFTVREETATAQIIVRIDHREPIDSLHYLGAHVLATGFCAQNPEGLRRHIGRTVLVSGLENVEIDIPHATAESAPDLESLATALPQQISAAGLHQATGHVLASWGGNTTLMRTASGRTVRVLLQAGSLPAYGAHVRVLGLPATDFYNINLHHAVWEPAGESPFRAPSPLDLMPSDLLIGPKGLPQLMVQYYGEAVRMTGIVRYLPDILHPGIRMQMEVASQLVPVDASAHPHLLDGLEIGTRVTISGTCVMNMDDWNINSSQKQTGGFFLVPHSQDDVVILSKLPWWTPGRLLTLVGLFATALLGAIGWNVSLNRRAKAKGRELAAEQLAHVTSELKVAERTRLAVELHDALSQTLTGVSMQIDTAAGFAEGKVPTISKCLAIASRTIDACRMELRNTLWDLRSAALDEPNMDAAIRKTLCQNLSGIDLSVRFNVPRETFSDNTAHAVLRIIRELATNALRHGKATSLKIAGTIDNGNLLFSVRDNGCGFDPDLAPGISQGHFGLQGISERLERLNGEMKIESAPGKGTKVTVALPIPRSGE